MSKLEVMCVSDAMPHFKKGTKYTGWFNSTIVQIIDDNGAVGNFAYSKKFGALVFDDYFMMLSEYRETQIKTVVDDNQ